MAGIYGAKNALLDVPAIAMGAWEPEERKEMGLNYKANAATNTATTPANDATGADEPAPSDRGAAVAARPAPIHMLVFRVQHRYQFGYVDNVLEGPVGTRLVTVALLFSFSAPAVTTTGW